MTTDRNIELAADIERTALVTGTSAGALKLAIGASTSKPAITLRLIRQSWAAGRPEEHQ